MRIQQQRSNTHDVNLELDGRFVCSRLLDSLKSQNQYQSLTPSSEFKVISDEFVYTSTAGATVNVIGCSGILDSSEFIQTKNNPLLEIFSVGISNIKNLYESMILNRSYHLNSNVKTNWLNIPNEVNLDLNDIGGLSQTNSGISNIYNIWNAPTEDDIDDIDLDIIINPPKKTRIKFKAKLSYAGRSKARIYLD